MLSLFRKLKKDSVKTRNYTTLTWKVILATIVGILTMYSVHIAIDHAFEEITTNFEKLAKPNDRLIAVNELFRKISQLNHAQQIEAASGSRNPSAAFEEESQAIYPTLDSLRIMFNDDTLQLHRIDEIEQRLSQREQMFREYLELLYLHNVNPDLQKMLGNLYEDRPEQTESSNKVVRLYETVTTTTVSSDTIFEEPAGFMERVFRRSQSPEMIGVVRTETRVDKDIRVIIDTIEMQQPNPDPLLPLLESSLSTLYTSQLQHLARIQNQELELTNTNSSLMHEIISIIKSVEQEEFSRLNLETVSVVEIAQNTISNLNYLAVIFISISIFLVILIIIDIFRSNKYRRRLEQAHIKARHESEAKQRFLSNMSHEIRTPLQSIYGYTEYARTNPGQKANIEAIYLSAKHLLKVVNEVLDYSKVTSGNISFEKKPFDPEKEIKDVVSAMLPLARQKNLNLSFENRINKSYTLMGDPFRLKQILFNLTGNAIKFTEEGEVKLIAELISTGKEHKLIICVKDTGIGITEEQLPHLFTEFAKPGSDHNSTGLGLSIVRKLILLQNGNIDVESQPKEGSCFTVTIPYETSGLISENSLISETNMESNGNGMTDFRQKKVLVVDDDPLILDLSSAILKKYNIPHQTFSNGQDILDALKAGQENESEELVIFLDIRMPVMNGLELCRKIMKLKGSNRNIRIFALTAQVLSDERQALLENGFDDIIIKPFQEKDILSTLSKPDEKIAEIPSPLNMEPLLKMTDNNNAEVRSILRTIMKTSRNDLKAIKRSFQQKKYEELTLLVHRMAGRVGQAGDREYASLLRRLERELQNDFDHEMLQKRINESLEKGDRFIMEVNNLIRTAKNGQ